MTLELIRGDTRTLDITNLLSGAGTPSTFAADDVVRFTVKRTYADSDANALIQKASNGVSPGVTLNVGFGTGTVTILPADWASVAAVTRTFVWDLQLAVAGSATDLVTLARGEGTIFADVTLTAP